jgi:hypothetical protein
MNFQTQIINPTELNLPATAEIQKILSDADRLSPEQHELAVKAFLLSDGIASGIRRDLAFVDKIPQFIKDIIENKLWECLCVAKGVATPYYCRYIKGTDSENFRAFISAKHPNGLESNVETIDRILQNESKVQRLFRTIIYESRQGERTDVDDSTSRSHCGKLNLSTRQQENMRAANRAAEAIPVVNDLLDRGLISIEVAAMLGRDIKYPTNLTAEERDYVDKRDLMGVRINQYIYSNPIPEDEDLEPQYGRELNGYIKDLLGVKDRSKSIRMDNPKKAANRLLQFYQGDSLQKLIDYLQQSLTETPQPGETEESQIQRLDPTPIKSTIHHGSVMGETSPKHLPFVSGDPARNQSATNRTSEESEQTSSKIKISDHPEIVNESQVSYSVQNNNSVDIDNEQSNNGQHSSTESISEVSSNHSVNTRKIIPKKPRLKNKKKKSVDNQNLLTLNELAERLNFKPASLGSYLCREPDRFAQHTQKRDPEGIAWQKSPQKGVGKAMLFMPIANDKNQ